MSKRNWSRDPLTGLPETVDVTGDLRERYPDCDLFSVNSITAAAGYGRRYYFEGLVEANPKLFHAHPVRDVNGRTVTLATATNSAQAGGANLRNHAAAAHRLNLKQFKTDPSSGSGS